MKTTAKNLARAFVGRAGHAATLLPNGTVFSRRETTVRPSTP